MARGTRFLSLLLASAAASSAPAGLHLGMKLACKKYGDAWSSGDKAALLDCVTDDFADVWRRMPDAMFASLPRTRTGDADVLASRKGPDQAMVRVATSGGDVTFVLVGQGFNWRVADVNTANMDGETVSLKQSLDASLAARDFLVGLSDANSNAWNRCLSAEMHAAMFALPADDWRRVRAYLPTLAEPAPTERPMVRFFGRVATMTVPMPACGPSAYAKVALLQTTGGWKVDDLEMVGQAMTIPSFKKGVPALAAVAMLGEFLSKPKAFNPMDFVAQGKLLEELLYAHRGAAAPPGLGQEKPKRLKIADDAHVYLHVGGRWVLVSTQRTSIGKAVIASLQLHEAGAWRDAADLLALQRTVKSNPLAGWLSQMNAPTGKTATVAANRPE